MLRREERHVDRVDSPRPEYFTAGDPLRGLAALAVAVMHVAGLQGGMYTGGFGQLPLHVVIAMQAAVSVFFVLSGYLVARPFVRAYLGGERPPPLGRYLLGRARRILPVYWVVFTVLLLLQGVRGLSGRDVLVSYFLLQPTFHVPWYPGFVHTWTVVVEVDYYFFLPVAAFVMGAVAQRLNPRGRGIALALVLVLVLAWVYSVLYHTEAANFAQALLLAFLWNFVPGFALAALEQTRVRSWARHAGARYVPAALLVLALGAFAALTATYKRTSYGGSTGIVVLLTVASGAMVAAPLVLQWSGRSCWRWLDNKPLHWVGARSYSLYMVHLAVSIEAYSWVSGLPAGWGTFALSLVLTLGISLLLAHALHETVERPFMRRQLPWRRRVPALLGTG